MFHTRNQIMDALIDILKKMPDIVTFDRRFKVFDNISQSAQMPYLCLSKPKEKYPPRAISSLPAKRTLLCEVVIWIAYGQDQKSIPDEYLNDIMDSLDEALQPIRPNDTQTLGGLVDHCYIAGDVTCVPGDLDGLGMIHIPIEIVIP